MGRKLRLRVTRPDCTSSDCKSITRRPESLSSSVNPSPLPTRTSQEPISLFNRVKKGRKTALQSRSRRSPTLTLPDSHQTTALSVLPKDVFSISPRPPATTHRRTNRSIECVSPLNSSYLPRPTHTPIHTIYSPTRSPILPKNTRKVHTGRSRSTSTSPLISLQQYFQAFHKKSRDLLSQFERRVLG